MSNQILSPMPIPLPSTSVLEDFSVNVHQSYGTVPPGRFLNLAVSVLVEHDIAVPDQEILIAIVRAALEAQHAFFVAAIYERTPIDLDIFLQDFVLRCASSTLIHTGTDNQTHGNYAVVNMCLADATGWVR